jgi:hypothetical protein
MHKRRGAEGRGANSNASLECLATSWGIGLPRAGFRSERQRVPPVGAAEEIAVRAARLGVGASRSTVAHPAASCGQSRSLWG